MRSRMRVAAIGCGVGILTWLVERTSWIIPILNTPGLDWAKDAIEEIVMGPVSVQQALEYAACIFWGVSWADDTVSLAMAVTYIIWLSIYGVAGYFVSATFVALPRADSRNSFRTIADVAHGRLACLTRLVGFHAELGRGASRIRHGPYVA